MPTSLPVPPSARDAEGYLVATEVWRHFAPALAEARQALEAGVSSTVDPVLREAMRLRNARTLACDH